MGARRSGRRRFREPFHNFGPLISRRPNQGLLNFNSWQAQVFIEMLGTMLTEQQFTDEIFEPITETYARFVRKARRNVWLLPYSNRLVVRVKYRRHAQRLVELLGAILTKPQFINLVLKPIIMTFIETYAKFILRERLPGDDDQYSDITSMDNDWNYAVEAFSSTPYHRIELDETIASTWGNSWTSLLPIDTAEGGGLGADFAY